MWAGEEERARQPYDESEPMTEPRRQGRQQRSERDHRLHISARKADARCENRLNSGGGGDDGSA